jgi:transcriptional regulator with XRE-family HTH domain
LTDYETHNAEYRERVARLLLAARTRAGVNLEEMAALVSVRAMFPHPLEPARLREWEAGTSFPVPVAVLLAAFEVAGVDSMLDLEAGGEADRLALATLERTLGETRELLRDPDALMRRARRLRVS